MHNVNRDERETDGARKVIQRLVVRFNIEEGGEEEDGRDGEIKILKSRRSE